VLSWPVSPVPVDAVLVDAAEACEAFPPLQVLATHTGALAFAGAFAAAAGFTATAPT